MPLRRAYRWERQFVARLWQGIGRPPVRLILWDGSECGATDADVVGAVRFADPGTLRALWWDAALGFGDGYRDGRITVDGDLMEVLEALLRGMAQSQAATGPAPTWRSRLVRRRGHSFAESKSSVYHHYDLGNEFYRLWLDEQMVYTCAYYEQPDASLEQAQVAKFDHICRKLRLQPGDVVAEAGCGWGAFALHMARQYGARVRAFNLSKEQLAYARHRARCEGLDDRVEFIEDD
jgi:cyclopropane-fatty-acyl-phospholipid synthase